MRFRGRTSSSRQSGVAGLLLVFILLIGVVGWLLSGLSSARPNIEGNDQTAAALAQAKEALIGYAVTFYDKNPGEFAFLPCPNWSSTVPPASEGSSQGPCGSKYANYVGRLPWKSLGIPVLRDGDGECLWYAVAGSYKNANVKTDMLNEDTDGQFEIFASDGVTRIAGSTPGSRPVAVVFAGGAILSPQNRSLLPAGTEICGGNFGAANYLDAANGRNNAVLSLAPDNVDTLFTGDAKDASGNVIANERLIYITKEEIFDAIKKRTDFNQKLESLTQSLATCIRAYGLSDPLDRRLPWAAPLALTDYRDIVNYVDENNRLSGRLPDQAPITQGTTGRAFSISSCLSSNPEQLKLWENWKDHFFYAVAEAFKPSPLSPPGTQACSPLLNNCYTVNGGTTNKYSAIVFFARSALSTQSRTAPPDPDAKANISNYLEDRNDDPNVGNNDYQTENASATFNDFLVCIDDSLVVIPCGNPL